MKGRYNPTTEGHAVLNQAEDEEESPAAGSESHKYLGGFEVENDEEDMEWSLCSNREDVLTVSWLQV